MPTYTTPSANMLLPVPIVGVDPGPDYAQNVNNCFFFVDAHDHSPGKGLQITPSGMNINATLTFSGNAATNLSYVNFNSQLSVSAIKSLYVINNDLYFRDGNNNSIAITSAGGVAGTPGSIGSLVAPASVTYNVATQTFVFAATATQAASIDGATFILRNTTAPFNGVTLSAPLALPSSYNIVLPTLPSSGLTSFVVMDASGNMSAPWRPDYSSLNINGSNQLFATAGTPDGVTLANTGGTLAVRNGDREHGWELNGLYYTLSYPQTSIDSTFFAQYAITITGIWIFSGTNGTAGTTEFDLKYKATPSGAFATIFSTTGKISATTALPIGSLVTTGAVSPYTVTVTTTLPHGFVAGDSVTIAGVTPAAYNGTWTVVAVPTTTSFTYSITTTQGSNTVAGTLATRVGVYTDSGTIVPAQAGVVKPVLSVTAIPAGSVIRFDLLSSMTSGGTDARIRMYYRQS